MIRLKTLGLVVIYTITSLTSFAQTTIKLNKKLNKYVQSVTTEFSKISDERKQTLKQLGDLIIESKQKNNKAILTFFCTTNSRRSHIAQVWMETASIYYGVDSVITFSGGSEVSEINERAVKALKRAGFKISRAADNYNSPYLLGIGTGGMGEWVLYSKKFDNFQNPKSNFIGVMICSESDHSNPSISGASHKIDLPYEDPKFYDNTPSEEQKYDETCKLIARELFFVANYVKTTLIINTESIKK